MKPILYDRWHFNDVNERDILTYVQKFDIPEFIARILISRNIELDQVEKFLNPTIREYLPDPFSFIDMEKAVDRVIDAINNKENITIFGDYDVDGATSLALLTRFFSMIKIKNDIYVPDRIKEGYGPNKDAITKLKTQGSNLIITVDCGISSFDPIAHAKAIGINVIVIDHHIGSANMPDAFAIVNPNRIDESKEYSYLAAVGVAFIFAVAINKKLRDMGYYKNNNLVEPDLLSLLDLVAIGTICDVVPLVGLNRAMVKQGLKIVSKRRNSGITRLIDISGINEEINTYHAGFMIGPRINAGGRVGKSELGAIILTTLVDEEALEIAKLLDHHNKERQAIETVVLEQAIDKIEKNQLYNNSVIVVYEQDWHVGVIGIVASRIKEKYNKPVAVISFDSKTNIGKASCRSIYGVDFGATIISAVSIGILLSGGGHKMAAGFTISKDNIDLFKQFLEEKLKDIVEQYGKEKILKIDSFIDIKGINNDIIDKISLLSPFGQNNPEPRFVITNCYIAKTFIMAESHIKAIISSKDSGASGIEAIAWKSIGTDLGEILLNPRGKNFDIAGKIKINNWMGRNNMQIIIDDIAYR